MKKRYFGTQTFGMLSGITTVDTAVVVHRGVAMSNLGYGSECCGSRLFEGELLRTPLGIEDGLAYSPQGPRFDIVVEEATLDNSEDQELR